MRLAGSQDVHDALSEQQHVSKFDKFVEAFERLREKGLSKEHAEQFAIEMAEGREPMVKLTTRFAGTYGDQSEDSAISDSAD
jgi:hypothetical protein